MVGIVNPNPEPIKRAIVRIRHSNGTIVGAGFLISDSCLLTCAHVVTEALGLNQRELEAPTALVEIDLILGDDTFIPLQAQVIFWSPVDHGKRGEDIAGLKLQGTNPHESSFIKLKRLENWYKRAFATFGYPRGQDSGTWAHGELIGSQGGSGWVQMEAIKAQGCPIQPGFSGSPIWDEELGVVVGMAIAAERKREEARTAFMIPTHILATALEAISLIEILSSLYSQNKGLIHTAFRGSCPNGWSRPVPNTLARIVAELQNMPQGNAQYSRIVQFVAYLINHISTIDQESLREWVKDQGHDLRSLLQTMPVAPTVSPMSYLIIKVDDTNPKSGQYFVKAWFAPCDEHWNVNCRAIAVPLPPSGQIGFTPEEIPNLLDDFLNQVDEFQDLTIEFFLPLELLNQAVDTWETQGYGISQLIGHEYKVIVRSVERLQPNYNRYRGAWQEKWQILQANPRSQDALIEADRHNPKSLLTELNSKTSIGAKLTQIPEAATLKRIFAAMLQSGIPIGLWLRQCPTQCNSHEDLAQTLNCCVIELPETIRQARFNAYNCDPDAHIGHHLSLLWEDPNRLPEILQYQMP